MFNLDEIMRNIRKSQSHGDSKQTAVIDHTRMEELIFTDKKKKLDEFYAGVDYTISEIEDKGREKLNTFSHLSKDLFNMFYKSVVSEKDNEELAENVARFNKKIVEKVKANPDYTSLRLITEAKDLESIEGAREFLNELYENLDGLMEDIAGDKGTLNQLDKLQDALEAKEEQLRTSAEIYQGMLNDGKDEDELQPLHKQILALNNQVEGIQKKVRKFNEIVEASSLKNDEKIDERVQKAIKKTIDKVHEIQDALDSFGTEDGRPKTIEGKTELIKKVNNNPKFKNMAQLIGKMRRLAKSELNKKFTSGMGERVGIEYGNKINKVLGSEFAYLVNDASRTLFIKKMADKKLKQYKERAIEFKGRGHVVFMVDESGSTAGGKELWAKALAIALMDIAVKDHRNFGFIPFSTEVGDCHHINQENYSDDVVLQICNSFIGGGTDFTAPILKAIEFIEMDEYQNADIVFITDGQATIAPDVMKQFNELKARKKTKCVGILLDKGGSGRVSDVTIKTFCDVIHRTSELSEDIIASRVMSGVA